MLLYMKFKIRYIPISLMHKKSNAALPLFFFCKEVAINLTGGKRGGRLIPKGFGRKSTAYQLLLLRGSCFIQPPHLHSTHVLGREVWSVGSFKTERNATNFGWWHKAMKYYHVTSLTPQTKGAQLAIFCWHLQGCYRVSKSPETTQTWLQVILSSLHQNVVSKTKSPNKRLIECNFLKKNE